MNYSLTFCLQKYIISWYHVFRYANNLICIYRGVAQFGRALRSGYRTERFDQNLPNRDNPLKYATLSPSQYS